MVKIKSQRLQSRLMEMARFGGLSSGGVKRLTLTEEDKGARNLLRKWMNDLGLEVHVDEIGNMFGILSGKNKDRFIGTGSHLDSVPTGGKYDGPLGVLAALEVAETIVEHKIQLNHSLVVANYTNEEGVRFFPDMMGSLAHVNPNKISEYLSAKDEKGITVKEAAADIGYNGKMKCGAIRYNAFVELHIEQGPILEQKGIDIGVVKGVQAILWIKLTIEGKSGHAGTTPIAARKDTFYAFSRLSNYARQLCSEIPGQLITIGSIELSPNAINVIPEKVIATLDIRNPSDEHLADAIQKVHEFIAKDDSFQNLKVSEEVLVDVPAVRFDQRVTSSISRSCQSLGYSEMDMFSGAGHDAQILATRYPAAMVFIPSKDGISHAVDEYSSPELIEKGANVLLQAILHLDQD
ncbi:MAG: M20 family metallo-hydrolase [Cyclobacteriaceae bacterium]|nr:M20 family metallo-hydrolase [Cyclobacteriaceae bacterium]